MGWQIFFACILASLPEAGEQVLWVVVVELEVVPVALWDVAAERHGGKDGEGGHDDVHAGDDGREPQQDGVGLLPRPELPDLLQDLVVVHVDGSL